MTHTLAWIIILNTILDHFGPMVAQMLQMVRFGTILDHSGPFREVGTIYPHLEINVRFPAQLRLHSKWLSLRNSFGITPKGPMGPIPPKGAEGALGFPLGPCGSPWFPLPLPLPPMGPPKGIGTL